MGTLRSQLKQTSLQINEYLEKSKNLAMKEPDNLFGGFIHPGPSFYWDQLTSDLQAEALELINKFLPLCSQLAAQTKNCLLAGPEDVHEVKIATKSIRAAIQLRKYHYSLPDVLHDEGNFVGARPARQSEEWGISPSEAVREFEEGIGRIASILKLTEASIHNSETSVGASKQLQNKYVAGTAFVMMWMDPKNPDLNDVLDTVKNAFASFGIKATRADDIEHEGQITEKILNEIRTSEFLFADLTGARPNVYYETGYAHALGKRVILFRKKETSLHFDLAGYNCPEYENLRDLREKLVKRLSYITSKQPNFDRTL